ncbi:hypothetical protein [Streptomyces chryseus]
MSHDLLAELAGYQAELAREERNCRTERAAAVREQLDRVREAISEKADALEVSAEDYTDQGQDVRAAQAAVEARELRRALESDGPEPDPGGPAEKPAPVFVPHEKNVGQVLEYLEAQDDVDEMRRVLDAEADAPTPRKGITDKRDELLARFAPEQ